MCFVEIKEVGFDKGKLLFDSRSFRVLVLDSDWVKISTLLQFTPALSPTPTPDGVHNSIPSRPDGHEVQAGPTCVSEMLGPSD